MSTEPIPAIEPLLTTQAIRLEAFEDKERRFWYPEESTILTRVEALPASLSLSDPAPCPENLDEVPTVRLTERIGRAPQREPESDIYRASLVGDETLPGLVVKVVDIRFIPRGEDREQAPEMILLWLFHECDAFARAKSVQGSVVPYFAGLFAKGHLYCLVFEDAGREISDEEREDENVQFQVVEATKVLYALDVVPKIMNWHVIRRQDSDGRIRISTLWDAYTDARLTPNLIALFTGQDPAWGRIKRKKMMGKLKKMCTRFLSDVLPSY